MSFPEYGRKVHTQIMNWEAKIEKDRQEGTLPKYPQRVYPCEVQWTWYTDFRGNLLADYIGQFEELERGFKIVCDHIGIEAELPHVNAANSRKSTEYRDHYNDETRALVAEYAWREIEMFNYVF